MKKVYKPYISVMMPAYNTGSYIREALESLRVQTYEDFEVIIVDDASVDGSYDIAIEYQQMDERFKVLQNGENLGNGASRQKALVHSCGDYIAFLDSDDRWLPEKLDVFVQRLREDNDRPLCIHSNAAIIDSQGCRTGENFQQRVNKADYPLTGDLFEYLLCTNWINMPSSMVEREALIAAGGFRRLYNMVDWDMWIRYARNAEFIYIDQELTEYRIHPQGISAANKLFRIAESREDVFRNSLELFAGELDKSILSRIYYLRGANLLVLGMKEQARKYFWKSWKYNMLAYKSLLRSVF